MALCSCPAASGQLFNRLCAGGGARAHCRYHVKTCVASQERNVYCATVDSARLLECPLSVRMARSFKEECSYLEKMSDYCYKINKGFVPNMKVSSNK